MKRPGPNVIVVMVDQMKAAASHLYGNTQCVTPNLEALAKTGIRYDRAYTPHPLCVPARIAFWTSRWSHNTGCRTNEAPMPALWHPFMAWKEAGYATALIGKNHCFDFARDEEFFDVWCEVSHRGLSGDKHQTPHQKGMRWPRPTEAIYAAHRVRLAMPMTGALAEHAVTDFPLADYSTSLVATQAAAFIEAHRDRPFAMWISFPDPHDPYEAPAEYARLFPPESIGLPPSPPDEFATAPERNRVLAEILRWRPGEAEALKRVVAVYYAMIRFIDDELARITATLDRCGLRDDTIVIFTSDHGDFAGEHRMMEKGGVFYDCLTRVPLVMSWPGLPAGSTVDAPVSLIDIVPTLLHLQGLVPPPEIDGRPLPGATDAPARAATFAEYGCGAPAFRMRDLKARNVARGNPGLIATLLEREYEGLRAMVCDGRWKFVHDPTGDDDELYDLESDPWELRNLSADPHHHARCRSLGAMLDAWRPIDSSRSAANAAEPGCA
jgi:arylsulfatase A-like enzyme